MSTRKGIVENYKGFRRTDHAQILSCLTDDVVWARHGYKTMEGKDAFDAEIENDAFEGSPSSPSTALSRRATASSRRRQSQLG